MPKFATISPTHISGKKKFAWENFKNGNYVAIGSKLSVDLTGKTMEEVAHLIRSASSYNQKDYDKRIREYEDFIFNLNIGDYVAVKNVNYGLFGIGIVTSEYYFKKFAHNTGSTNPHEFYCHFRDVKWLITSYMKREDIVRPEERAWAPYGIINVYSEVPGYIRRIIGRDKETSLADGIKKSEGAKGVPPVIYKRPSWLLNLIENIEKLMEDPEHKERAHESLVETFYELLGFVRYVEIKYRQGRIDISIEYNNKPLIVNEVKRNWSLSWRDRRVLLQAYNYALETGAPFVVLTNGDYYAIFDRRKGYSYESQFVGDFKLTKLKPEDLEIIKKLKKENISFK